MIEAVFSHFRKVSIIAVISSAAGSLLMFFIGAVKVLRAVDSYFSLPTEATAEYANRSGPAIAYLVQSIDAFLIALVLMIFSSGVYRLLISDAPPVEGTTRGPFQIRSITELKRILADMIIIILMVKFLESALVNSTGFEWEALVLPGAILLLAAAVRVLKLEH